MVTVDRGYVLRRGPIWLLAVLALFVPARANAAGAFSAAIVRTSVAPKIDGTLDDSSWRAAKPIRLQWDLSFEKPATEETTAYLLADARFLYVAFVAKQREPITANQRVDDAGLANDDDVRIILWPGGDQGFKYIFESNPLGTRYAQSSENAAFAPSWVSAASRTADGYIVTERIPLAAMRGDGRPTWRIQFSRRIVINSGQMLVWAHSPAQQTDDSPQDAAYLHEMDFASHATRTKPRASFYTLAQAGSASAGSSTSRAGLDLAIPITATSSLLATVHPDYSNVELDQQTISPTAFARQYREIRPFFTQGAGFYNQFHCDDCLDIPFVYTPSIPTPREGFAIEGAKGHYNFGAFDALSDQRADSAQSVTYKSTDRRYGLVVQRAAVDEPQLHDDASYVQASVGNGHNFTAFATLGSESGSLVTQPEEGRYREYSVNLYSPKAAIYASYHDVGSMYAPVDGFVQINDVKGPTITATRELDFAATNFLQSVAFTQDYERYHNHLGALNQTINSSSVLVSARNRLSLSLSTGSQYLLLPGRPGGWANQNGIAIGYGNNTALPTSLSFNSGEFGAGRLFSTTRLTTLRVTRRATLSLEADDTSHALVDGTRDVQWLERASLAFQISPRSSLAVGARRIIGVGPTFFSPTQYINASNVSAAYYLRRGPQELYVAYGDPNALATSARLIVKYIYYLGAQKGA